MDEISPQAEVRGFSRRDMLRRSALVGGTMVWMAPAVQTLAAPAFAAGSPAGGDGPGSTYSEIALLVKCGTTVYRYKFEPQTAAAPGPLEPTEDGARFNLGVGQNQSASNMNCDDFFRNDNVIVVDVNPNAVSGILGVDGSVTVRIDAGCELVAFAWHNGQCCFQIDGGAATAAGAPPVPNGTYGAGGLYAGVTVSGDGPTTGDIVVFAGNPPNAPPNCP